MMLKPSSLRQRTTLYILVPTCLFLLVVELISFRSIRETLIRQMESSAVSHLQRTAAYIDTRLRMPKTLLYRLVTAPSAEVRQYILEILTSLNGITELSFTPARQTAEDDAATSKVTSSQNWKLTYLPLDGTDHVTLTAIGDDGRFHPLTAKVLISFYDFIGHIPDAPWWTDLESYLIDASGNILVPRIKAKSSAAERSLPTPTIPENIQAELLAAMQRAQTGIIPSGERNLPGTLYGFYQLTEAPWTLVVRTLGSKALQPLTSFNRIYVFLSVLTTALVLYLINLLTTRTIKTINSVSAAASRLAEGHFDTPLSSAGNDELGELIKSFNAMSKQLQKGVQLKKAMAIAGEVQRNLLPPSHFTSEKLSVSGISLPCDETGGDFFDILNTEQSAPKLTVVVGDVVGHGIGAALLMATARALLRSSVKPTGNLGDCVSAVNTLLCRDTESSGNFVTIFLLAIDKRNRTLCWVRAGHEPAMLYNLKKDTFSDLRGKGVALGVDEIQQYQENRLQLAQTPYLVIINTDGVTDITNETGERFGKQRLKAIIRHHASQSPARILQALSMELKVFRGKCRQHDDITLVIAKTA
ncbi:MAG: PP2C family protein-serine/threonine phosphatase [Desulforhopalus sp.]